MPRHLTARTLKRRPVGVRADLTLTGIIKAARSLEPDALTMQSLADHLGVDRKALNHHVNDRDTLLGLVALDAFSASFSAVKIAARSRWQDACRIYARGFTDSAIVSGALAERIRVSDTYVTKVLEPTEAVLRKMISAGFDHEAAMRLLSLLTNICLAYARDIAFMSRSGIAPRPAILRKALEKRRPEHFKALAQIAKLGAVTYDRAQLELSIRVFVSGAEALLETTLAKDTQRRPRGGANAN